MCDPILISSWKSRIVERAASDSTVIRGSVSKRFLITPFERSSASISSRFPLINCSIFCVCYYLFSDYPLPTIWCNLINATYYLKYSNLFKLNYSFHNVFTRWIIHFPPKIQTKLSLLRIIVSLLTSSSKSLEKQQRDTLLSDRLEIKGLGIYFAKESPPPSSRKFTRVPWGYKFLWISAVLPVSWATVLRFNWVEA